MFSSASRSGRSGIEEGGGAHLLELVFLCLLVLAGFCCLAVQLLCCELFPQQSASVQSWENLAQRRTFRLNSAFSSPDMMARLCGICRWKYGVLEVDMSRSLNVQCDAEVG
jgi:hypothetical protein